MHTPKPLLTVELINGDQFRIVDRKFGRFDHNGGFREEPLMCRIVNTGAAIGVSEHLVRCWEFTEPIGVLTDLNTSMPPEAESVLRASDLAIPLGPHSASGPIATFVDQVRPPTADQWSYFHGSVAYSDLFGNYGITGFCFVYAPKFAGRGFHVAVPPNAGNHWYYDDVPLPQLSN